MYKSRVFICFIVAIFTFAGTAAASNHDAGMKVVPVELYAWKYREGQGPGDLEEVITMWSSWADKQGMENYAAWTLTPPGFYWSQMTANGITALPHHEAIAEKPTE